MKAICRAAAALVAVSYATTAWGAAGEAEARLSCSSVRMHRGVGDLGLYTLDFSSVQLPQAPNGELGPFSDDFTHAAYFALNDPSGLDPMQGIVNLDVPLESDVNGNGFADFFEVAEDGSGNSAGVYSIPGVVPSGTVVASWTRGAGSAQGTCLITLQNLGNFTHTFEIIEYKGTLKYQPGATKVSGTIHLAQTGNPGNTLQGAVEFLKASADPHNQLRLTPGSWTNSAAETLSYAAELFEREAQAWPTNYYGYVEFDNDSDPGSFFPYALHLLSIDDLNDRDRDGIPDFSDDPSTAARVPILVLTSSRDGLILTIQAEAGMVCDIQESNTLASNANWQTVRTVTLSGSSQEIQLPVPASSAAYWRVRVQ